MPEFRKRSHVLAVLGGTWGHVSHEEADQTLRVLMESLVSRGRREGIEVVVDFAATLDEVPGRLAQGGYALVVFNSRGILEEARKIKAAHPRTTMVLLTGAIPEDELIILSKDWLGGEDNPLFRLL